MSNPYPKVRLFVESHLEKGASVLREDDAAHYLARVMRMKEGDRVALFNGRHGEWAAVLHDVRKHAVELRVQEQLRDYLPPSDIWLCFAPIKFGRIDYLIQKATELGASVLQPVMTQFTQSERVNEQRLRANAIEAAEQCERVEVPELKSPMQLRDLLATWPKDRVLLFADESGQSRVLIEVLPEIKDKPLAVLIGPEGGFSPEERELLYRIPQVIGVGLGPRILRADTAAIALLAAIQSTIGDWHIAPHFQREGM